MKYLVIKCMIFLFLIVTSCNNKKESDQITNNTDIVSYEYDFFQKYISVMNDSKSNSIPNFITSCPKEIIEHRSASSPAGHNYSYPYYSVYREILSRSNKEKVMNLKKLLLSKQELSKNEEMVLIIIKSEIDNTN